MPKLGIDTDDHRWESVSDLFFHAELVNLIRCKDCDLLRGTSTMVLGPLKARYGHTIERMVMLEDPGCVKKTAAVELLERMEAEHHALEEDSRHHWHHFPGEGEDSYTTVSWCRDCWCLRVRFKNPTRPDDNFYYLPGADGPQEMNPDCTRRVQMSEHNWVDLHEVTTDKANASFCADCGCVRTMESRKEHTILRFYTVGSKEPVGKQPKCPNRG